MTSTFNAMAVDPVVHALQETTAMQGFLLNIRSMFVSTYILLLLWILLLLAKYLTNVIRPYSTGSIYDSYMGGGGGGKGGSRFGWGRKKGMGAGGAPPPPPPPPGGAMGTMPGGNGGGMQGMGPGGPESGFGPGGMGAGPTGVGPNNFEDWSHGVESERGYPGESRLSVRLSRAADVVRLGFLFLLGGTAISALSNGAKVANQVLGWIFFALIVLWMILAFATPNRWVPLIMGLLSFPMIIAVWAVAFQVDRDSLATFEGPL